MRFFGNEMLYPDTTQEADKQIGTYDEPQVFIKGRRMVSLRGNRFGMQEGFTYAAQQFIGFKPSLAHNCIECLGWILFPSLLVNLCQGLFLLGVPPIFLLGTFGLFFLLFISLFAYALSLNPSLTTPGGIRLALVLFAVIIL